MDYYNAKCIFEWIITDIMDSFKYHDDNNKKIIRLNISIVYYIFYHKDILNNKYLEKIFFENRSNSLSLSSFSSYLKTLKDNDYLLDECLDIDIPYCNG